MNKMEWFLKRQLFDAAKIVTYLDHALEKTIIIIKYALKIILNVQKIEMIDSIRSL